MFKKIQAFLLVQMKQGVTPHGIALACAVGLTGCLFPMLGATTLLCFVAAHFLRLNHPVVQTVNYASAPLQLLMFPVFLKLGAWICRVPAVSVNPEKIYHVFMESPAMFFQDYGWAWAQSMLAWAVVAPFVMFAVYKVVRSVLARTASRKVS
jgi:uncharacterized protein (DUF2062 family)